MCLRVYGLVSFSALNLGVGPFLCFRTVLLSLELGLTPLSVPGPCLAGGLPSPATPVSARPRFGFPLVPGLDSLLGFGEVLAPSRLPSQGRGQSPHPLEATSLRRATESGAAAAPSPRAARLLLTALRCALGCAAPPASLSPSSSPSLSPSPSPSLSPRPCPRGPVPAAPAPRPRRLFQPPPSRASLLHAFCSRNQRARLLTRVSISRRPVFSPACFVPKLLLPCPISA